MQTATSHQPSHPMCGDLSRCRLPPVINLLTLCAAIFPGADCHQSSTFPPYVRRSFQVQTATSHQPSHPMCGDLSRCRLPPVINLLTLCAAIFPGADCHQSSTFPPYVRRSFQVQTATSHQPSHPMCGDLSRCRRPPVINLSTLCLSLSRGLFQ